MMSATAEPKCPLKQVGNCRGRRPDVVPAPLDLGIQMSKSTQSPQDRLKVPSTMRDVKSLPDQVRDDVGAPMVKFVQFSVATGGAATGGHDEFE